MVSINLLHGDCLDKLKELDDDSIDSIVTDPPYGLSKEADMMEVLKCWMNGEEYIHKSKGFMGKDWDSFVPSPNIWKECLRVLKPGGHMVAFFGTRTYDMGVLSIRIAGFEIRDQLAWVFGSGFPKSLNVSNAIDKMSPIEDKLLEFSELLKNKRKERGLSISEADKLITGGTTMYSFLEGRKVNGENRIYKPSKEYYKKIVEHFNITGYEEIVENSLEIICEKDGSFGFQKNEERWKKRSAIHKITTDEAKQWDGWGTALKPAFEPIVLARKPLSEKTIAENVIKWGTGGINIDESRVPVDNEKLGGGSKDKHNFAGKEGWDRPWMHDEEKVKENKEHRLEKVAKAEQLGRFPSNFIHDGSDEVVALFPESKGQQGDVKGTEPSHTGQNGIYNEYGRVESHKRNDTGSAARFFYCAKASKNDRNEGLDDFDEKSIGGKGNGIRRICSKCGTSALEAHLCNCEVKDWINPATKKNNHPTVKPYSLMKYLVRMITPPNGIVLDPFMGSGSTGKAAVRCGFNFVGIELDSDYLDIAKARIEYARDNPEEIKKSKKKKENNTDIKKDLPNDLFE